MTTDLYRSVTACLATLKNAHQLVSIEDGWLAFLDYLRQRLGRDLRSMSPNDDVNKAFEYVYASSGDVSPNAPTVPPPDWFSEFERRPDVLEAFQRFWNDPLRGI